MKHFQKRAAAPNLPAKSKLPKYVSRQRTRHGKIIYYFRIGHGRHIRLPDQFDTPQFWEAYNSALNGGEGLVAKQFRIVEAKTVLRGQIGQALQKSVNAARQRAKEKKVDFDLDYDWAVAAVEAQDFRCALTGIRFFSTWPGDPSHKHPLRPSIDRIKPALGYTKANCRIVTVAINTMLLDWGEDFFFRIANSFIRHRSVRRKGGST